MVVHNLPMAQRRGHRGGDDGKRKRKPKPKTVLVSRTAPKQLTTEFGPLRVRERAVERGDYTWMELELLPSEASKLPAGAILGDPTRQNFGIGPPQLYYVDRQKRCESCARDFVFSAKEQQYWYEQLGFIRDSTAKDCAPCRKERRAEKKLMAQLRAAIEACRATPTARAHLDVARATWALREQGLGGNIDRAIGAARAAYRLDSKQVEALFWEARLQELAGRLRRAKETMQRFIDASAGAKRQRLTDLRRQARRLLAQ